MARAPRNLARHDLFSVQGPCQTQKKQELLLNTMSKNTPSVHDEPHEPSPSFAVSLHLEGKDDNGHSYVHCDNLALSRPRRMDCNFLWHAKPSQGRVNPCWDSQQQPHPAQYRPYHCECAGKSTCWCHRECTLERPSARSRSHGTPRHRGGISRREGPWDNLQV